MTDPAAGTEAFFPNILRSRVTVEPWHLSCRLPGVHRSVRTPDVAAAMYIISRHKIRRSSVTSIPESLRPARRVQVARL